MLKLDTWSNIYERKGNGVQIGYRFGDNSAVEGCGVGIGIGIGAGHKQDITHDIGTSTANEI
jgi:hypothetical protein